MGTKTKSKNLRTREIIWTTSSPGSRQLRRQGFHVLQYPVFRKRILSIRRAGTSRSSLKNPADSILSIFQRHAKIALLGVGRIEMEDLQFIHGYLVEPAFRCGCTLLISTERNLTELADETQNPRLIDDDWRYGWTLERLQHLVRIGSAPLLVPAPTRANLWRTIWTRVSLLVGVSADHGREPRLDKEQTAAVNAGDGVVQVIAPAGSGKTTVLIERVRELRRRGTETSRILCLSFNRDAKNEIGRRLADTGISGVVVRSFHGMGMEILKNEGKLRSGIDCLKDETLEQILSQATALEKHCSIAPASQDKTGTMPVSAARNAISEFKLAAMISADEALLGAIDAGVAERITARIYQLYQKELTRRQVLDFDDLVANAVTLLQNDPGARSRWQDRFHRVLVDEYQDIEPSQALLVGILAAPNDSIFCVGDEDQCIYAWRRATVDRIIELDQIYPGLERHALIRNYRCGRKITRASRRLIQNNQHRFRKPLGAGSKLEGDIAVVSCATRESGAALVAHLISDAVPSEVVVLARTSRLLDEVKAACESRLDSVPPVELATIHAAKGREWNRVILFAVDEGQTPHTQAVFDGGLEDERRLFYVAMTRAKQRLEIVCTKGRESRFLREAGLRVFESREPHPSEDKRGPSDLHKQGTKP